MNFRWWQTVAAYKVLALHNGTQVWSGSGPQGLRRVQHAAERPGQTDERQRARVSGLCREKMFEKFSATDREVACAGSDCGQIESVYC